MPLTLAQIEEQLLDLQEGQVDLERRLRSAKGDKRIPLLATAFDLEDAIFPGSETVRKKANESVTSSTTLQDDDHLKIAIGVSETWVFESLLNVAGPTAGDISIAYTVPSGATLMWGFHGLAVGAVAVEADLRAAVTKTSGGGLDVGLLFGTDTPIFILGIIVNGTTAGDLQMQWAQRVSNGTSTTIAANSWLKANRI